MAKRKGMPRRENSKSKVKKVTKYRDSRKFPVSTVVHSGSEQQQRLTSSCHAAGLVSLHRHAASSDTGEDDQRG